MTWRVPSVNLVVGLSLVTSLIAPTYVLAGQCGVSNGLSLPEGTNAIGISGDLSSATQAAVQKWSSGCAGAGSKYPSLNVNGTGEVPVNISFINGPRDDAGSKVVCEETAIKLDGATGVVRSATITIWAKQRSGSACGATQADLIAHALGHVLGLNDVPQSACDGKIMGRPLGQTSSYVIDDCACSEVDSRWVTGQEQADTTDPPGSDPASTTDPDCQEGPCSPIVVDLAGNGFRFTSLADGVEFDIDADGDKDLVSWTDRFSEEAFLVLDRNFNGTIDDGSELFGDATAQPLSEDPNGFLALAVFDTPELGGNGDGWISAADAIYSRLRLWRDDSHDGLAQPFELRSLTNSGVEAIHLTYVSSRRRDRHGNLLRWGSLVQFGDHHRFAAVDVIFLKE